MRGDEKKVRKEREAMTWLGLAQLTMQTSSRTEAEVSKTENDEQRQALLVNYNEMERVALDQKALSFHTITDQLGGWTSYPLVGPIQDEALYRELLSAGFDDMDAQHIAQAVSNKCDVFLTRDKNTILNRHAWLEQRLPEIHFRLPSELAAERGRNSA
jgi:hypothetical protein